MRLSFFAVTLALSVSALADVVTIPIPQQDWNISFDATGFARREGHQQGSTYIYRAVGSRYNLSIFVEPAAKPSGGSKEVYEFYWPQANRNPLISQPSVKVSKTDKFYRVQYDVTAGPQMVQKNVNYYFMSEGKWVDVHLSIIDFTKEDEAVIATFDKGLKYGK